MYPFFHASVYGRGTALRAEVCCEKHDTSEHEDVTDIVSAAVYKEESKELTLFVVNRNIEEDVELTADLRGWKTVGSWSTLSWNVGTESVQTGRDRKESDPVTYPGHQRTRGSCKASCAGCHGM